MEHYKNLDLKDIQYYCEIDLIDKVEQWKDVVGYDGLYMVSDLGRVKSLERYIITLSRYRNKMNKKINTRILKNIKSTNYLNVNLWGINGKSFRGHRLVAIAFIPNPENKPEVNHKKGIKTDNRESQIEWCTPKENTKHSYDVLKHKNGRRKLNEVQVKFIRDNAVKRIEGIQGNGNIKELCEKFKISRGSVHKILSFNTYK